MPAAYTTLELTDGTTSCNLVDNVNYSLVEGSWSPALTWFNESPLGDVYPRVTESLVVNALGSTGAIALANHDKLQRLLIQARRWAKGENGIAPVLWKVQMQGSTLAAAASSLVYGLPGGPAVVPPPTMIDDLFGYGTSGYAIEGIGIQFQHQGAYYTATESMTTPSAEVNGVIQNVSFLTTVTQFAPLTITLGNFAAGGGIPTTGGMLIVSNSTNHIKIVDSATFSGDVLTTSTVSDTANLPHGSSILRYTTPANLPHTLLLSDSSGSSLSDMTAAHVAIYGLWRNNSAGSTFEVTPSTGAGVGIPALIVPGGNVPQIVPMGIIAGTQTHRRIDLQVKNLSGIAGDTLDLDRIVVVGLDPPTQIVTIPPTSIASYQLASSLVVADQTLTGRKPAVYQLFSDASRFYLGYAGPLPLYSLGNTVVTCLVGTSGSYWRLVTAAGGVQNLTMQATRLPALLTPQ